MFFFFAAVVRYRKYSVEFVKRLITIRVSLGWLNSNNNYRKIGSLTCILFGILVYIRRGKFYRQHFDLVSKYYVGLKTLLLQGLSGPEFNDYLVYRFRKIICKKYFLIISGR